jgi:hypothetical protein
MTKSEKELKSFKNKLSGNDVYWFNSLTIKKQYDILFIWKCEKYNSVEKPTKVRKRIFGKTQTITKYPVKLKYFLKEIKMKKRFNVNQQKLRNTILNELIKE